MPIYKSGDDEAIFPEYKEILKEIATKAYLDLSTQEISENILQDIFHKIQPMKDTPTILIFMGAGKCSSYAHTLSAYLNSTVL